MADILNTPIRRPYLLSLEGVRGYAFLPVFLAHYFPASLFPYQSSPLFFPFQVVTRIAWLAVPIFFVLSGYLIGGILYETKDREGYFRVFYARRILRVFPVYYLTLLAIACANWIRGIPLNYIYWSHFFYIQNLLPGYVHYVDFPPLNHMVHFWSLAVEEQFYLLWPLVVWFCRDKKTLLRVTGILIGLSFLARFVAPLFHVYVVRCYFLTPTRVDAILLGVVLALIRRDRIYQRFEQWAKYAAIAGIAAMAAIATVTGNGTPHTSLGSVLEIPLVNLTAAAIVIAVIEEGSFACRICSVRWACWLGSLSYGLYIFHFTYSGWFLNSLVPRLSAYMPAPLAFLVSAVCAFCLTLLLAVLSYRFIERPAMDLKKRLKYGEVKTERASLEAA